MNQIVSSLVRIYEMLKLLEANIDPANQLEERWGIQRISLHYL